MLADLTFGLSVRVMFGYGAALVVETASPGECQFHLGEPIFEVDAEWHERECFLGDTPGELVYLLSVK
jgi:hypothetical protein